MSTDVQVRRITRDERAEWIGACRRGFLRPPGAAPHETDLVARMLDLEPDRTWGAFDRGRCVGTFRSIPRELTVPGGATLPASGVTSVTVTSTHRRRGLLSRMMDLDLAAARERGDPVAILIAAEYPIYGRFGFGPATWTTEWSVDVPRARVSGTGPPEHGRIDLADSAELRKAGPEFFDRVRTAVPGMVDRPDSWWSTATGELRHPAEHWEEPFHAVYRDACGRVDGIMTYTVDRERRWDHKMPQHTLTVKRAEFADPRAEAALWRHALSVDWITTLVSGFRPPDDVLPLLLGDPRAARVRLHADYMWLRVLDVPAALRARGYGVPGSLVLRLRDRAGHADGTYRLDAAVGPGASRVEASTEEPELAMDISELGTLYLGGESAVRLAAAGRVTELAPGAAARADLMLRTPRSPWCQDEF